MADIRLLLTRCAPGHSIETNDHQYWVLYNRKTFRRLPLGKHGHRRNVELEIGFVRSMIRHLGINLDCAKEIIKAL